MTLKRQNKHYQEQLDLTDITRRIKRLEMLAGIQYLDEEIRQTQMEDRVAAAQFLMGPPQ
jgi:hypothetical protein